MRLEKISLINFKNYIDVTLSFPNDINCFVGLNGSGKTNLLDAIHYLAITKSAFNSIDNQNIRHGQNSFFSIIGEFQWQEKQYTVQCSFQEKQKKLIKINQIAYDKISEHIGKIPMVLIHPNDTDIIRGGSEGRRKLFDAVQSQIDRSYLSDLIQYNHALKQRNSLLKKFNESRNIDYDQLEPYDNLIIEISKTIYNRRKQFVALFLPFFEKHYKNLSDDQEILALDYKSDVKLAEFEKAFKGNIDKDVMLSRTNIGIHKDDYPFLINNRPLKKFGSQGQQKTFIIALKLAQYDIMKTLIGHKPLLLLDDIFDKLDDHRIKKLMEMLYNNEFGQIFVTDARPERTRQIFESLSVDISIFHINDGRLVGDSKI